LVMALSGQPGGEKTLTGFTKFEICLARYKVAIRYPVRRESVNDYSQ
jgi:hypothetical protein